MAYSLGRPCARDRPQPGRFDVLVAPPVMVLWATPDRRSETDDDDGRCRTRCPTFLAPRNPPRACGRATLSVRRNLRGLVPDAGARLWQRGGGGAPLHGRRPWISIRPLFEPNRGD